MKRCVCFVSYSKSRTTIVILLIASLIVLALFVVLELQRRKNASDDKLPPLVGSGLSSFGRMLVLMYNLPRFYDFLEQNVKKLGLLLRMEIPIYGNIYLMIRCVRCAESTCCVLLVWDVAGQTTLRTCSTRTLTTTSRVLSFTMCYTTC